MQRSIMWAEPEQQQQTAFSSCVMLRPEESQNTAALGRTLRGTCDKRSLGTRHRLNLSAVSRQVSLDADELLHGDCQRQG